MGRNPPNKTLCFWGYSSYGMIERNPEMKSNPFHSVHAFRLSPSRNPVGFVLGSNDDNKLLPNRLFSSMNTWNRSIRISWFMSWPVAVFFFVCLFASELWRKVELYLFFYIQFFIQSKNRISRCIMMPQDMCKKDSAHLCSHFWLGWKRIVTRTPANVGQLSGGHWLGKVEGLQGIESQISWQVGTIGRLWFGAKSFEFVGMINKNHAKNKSNNDKNDSNDKTNDTNNDDND